MPQCGSKSLRSVPAGPQGSLTALKAAAAWTTELLCVSPRSRLSSRWLCLLRGWQAGMRPDTDVHILVTRWKWERTREEGRRPGSFSRKHFLRLPSRLTFRLRSILPSSFSLSFFFILPLSLSRLFLSFLDPLSYIFHCPLFPFISFLLALFSLPLPFSFPLFSHPFLLLSSL